MTVSANLNSLLDSKYEDLDLHELTDVRVDALAGVSAADAEALDEAFGIRTIGDLGRNEQIRAAIAITTLADASQ